MITKGKFMIQEYFKIVTIFSLFVLATPVLAMDKRQRDPYESVKEVENLLYRSQSPDKGSPSPASHTPQIRHPEPQRKVTTLAERIAEEQEELENEKWCHACIIQYFSRQCQTHQEAICQLKEIIDCILSMHVPGFDYHFLEHTSWDLSQQIIKNPRLLLSLFPESFGNLQSGEKILERSRDAKNERLVLRHEDGKLESLKSRLEEIKKGKMIEQFKALVYDHYWWLRASPRNPTAREKYPFTFSIAGHHRFSVL